MYVDDMRARHGRLVMCHMISDREEELHGMVKLIGVDMKWYQGDHYDVAMSKRALAVEAGAVEITQRQCGCMVMRRRIEGVLGEPQAAIAWVRAHLSARRAKALQATMATG